MSSPTQTQNTQSKPKNKQKKSQEMIQLQHKFQALIKQNLELKLTISQLNDRAIIMKHTETTQEKSYLQKAQQAALEIDKLKAFNQAKDEHIEALNRRKDQIEIQNGMLNYQLEKLKKQIDEYKHVTKQEYDDLKKYNDSEMKRYEQIINEYQTAINERVEYFLLNQSLQRELQSTKENHKQQIADKDRDKLQAIDFIKKQMHEQAKELKSSLLSMRRDQMATNTRLTVLQNQQLIEELEYQSKNTEKVVKQNVELEKTVEKLTKQLWVEKQTVQEFAKRSTIAKKIIKTLNDKNAALEKSVEKAVPTESVFRKSLKQKSHKVSIHSSKEPTSRQSFASPEETIKFLSKTITNAEMQLNEYQQKMSKLQQQKNHYKQLYETNQPKYEYYFKHEADLKLLMIRFLSSALEGQILGQKNDVEYDISRLRGIPVDDWAKSDVEMTIKMLLTFLRPHFTMKNMKTEYLKHKKWQISNPDTLDDLIKQSKPQQSQQNDSKENSEVSIQKSRHKRLNYSKTKSFSTHNLNSTLNNPSKKVNSSAFASANVSANVSPQKNMKDAKDFSLLNALQQYKRKSLSKKEKSLSSQDLSEQLVFNAEIIKYKHTGELKENVNQKHEFKPQQFRKDKQTSKLVRTNIRDWGKKVEMNSKGVYIFKQK